MSSGTRVAIGFGLFGLAVLAVLLLYGRESLSRREPDSAAAAARAMLQADNTVVGLVGGIRTFDPVAATGSGEAESSTVVEARVLGSRDSGLLVAELVLEDGRWSMRHARFTLSDGTTIPVAGSAGR